MHIDANRVVAIANTIANRDFQVTVSLCTTGAGRSWEISVGESGWSRTLVVKSVDGPGADGPIGSLSDSVLGLQDAPAGTERTFTLRELIADGYVGVRRMLEADNPPMSESRKRDIALRMVEHVMLRRQLPAPNDFMREIGNTAKDIGVDIETLKKFYEALLPKIIGRMLGRKNVSVTSSN